MEAVAEKRPNTLMENLKSPDLALSVGVIMVLSIMIVPLPTWMLDILLTFNLSLSLVVLANALLVNKPLELSVFPSLMLVVTLFRLALNVASTRLILGQAYAGDVISAFGSFVIKDNYVVGFVIFIILVAIQYLVVVRGTERNAEVGARFTLDAMPGKQMSIDADLNAGLINEEEAIVRREDISREANFYGAMDGAAKFVRGDAIAGIVITLVNILAGFVVGVLQLDLSPVESLKIYSRLTIGDGLVSQIPALIISTSAGIVVSRASSSSKLGVEIKDQLFGQQKPLAIVSGALCCLALVPGIPTMPLLLIASAMFGLSRVRASERKKTDHDRHLAAQPPEPPKKEESPEDYLKIDRLEVAIGYGLIPMMDADRGSDFLDRVVALRRQIAGDVGIIVPMIRVRDDIRLKPDEYEIRIKTHRVAGGTLMVGHHLAMGADEALSQLEGVDTREPAFGLNAKWINNSAKSRAEDLGLTAVGASVVLATHLTEVVRNHAWEIFSRQDVKRLIDEFEKESPALVKDIIPEQVSLGTVHRVLQNLLKERVPIRDLGTILETLIDFSSQVKDMDLLTEYVRAGLSRAISGSYVGPDRKLHVITIDPALEQQITQTVKEGGGALAISLPPAQTQKILDRLKTMIQAVLERQERPAVLCSPQIRLAIRRLTEASFPAQPVLSYHEIAPDVDLYSVGVLSLEEPESSIAKEEKVAVNS